jgi:hypothetical protein
VPLADEVAGDPPVRQGRAQLDSSRALIVYPDPTTNSA